MSQYVIKRLLQGLLLVLVVSILVFAMMDFMPGDPIELLTDRKVSQEIKDKLRSQYGLDLPFHQRYFNWVTDALRGNFGMSIRTKLPVNTMLAQRLPTTIKLTGIALLIEILIAIPIGLLAAYKKDGLFDRLMMSISLFFAALPSFWVAVLLI
ncbi:MAG TPA: ABC transporter permease, partial [Clostridia bacterium]|nr:ABC transporter permease [Clostridia bacterium]